MENQGTEVSIPCINMMGHLKGLSQRDSQLRVRMTTGRGVLEKFDRTTWHSGWMPRFWKFSRKSYWAFPSQNQTWRGGTGGLEEEDLEPRGFRAGVDLRLGAMRSLSEGERERKHITTKKREMKGYVCMKYAWTCDVQNITCIMGKTNPNLPEHVPIIKHTSKCMKHC